jgi:hypothetical protein
MNGAAFVANPTCSCLYHIQRNYARLLLLYLRPLKNGFTASQKSFPLRGRPGVIMIQDKLKTSSLERRKTFDSPLANHFSAFMQRSLFITFSVAHLDKRSQVWYRLHVIFHTGKE